MRGLGPAILTVTLAAASAAGAQAPPAAAPQAAAMPGDAQFAAAAALASGKKHAEAVPALEKFLAEFKQHPKALAARLWLGDALLALEKPDAALKAYEAALAEKPEGEARAEVLFGAARAHAALKADDRALEPLREAFKLTEYSEKLGAPVAVALGELLTRAEKHAEAAPAFYRATRWLEHPDAPRAYYMVGESYRLAGDLGEAALAFRNAAEKHPDSPVAPRAAMAAAAVYLQAGKPDEAEREYRRVLDRYTRSEHGPMAQLGLGRVASAKGNHAVARHAYQAAAVLFPSVAAEAALRTADSFLAEKNQDEARKRYTALLEDKDRPVAGEARYSLARLHASAGEAAPAVEHYRALSHDRTAGRWAQLGRLRLAELRMEAGDYGNAIAALRPTLMEGTEPAIRDETLFRIGESLIRREEFAGAETELTPLAKRSPSGPWGDAAAAFVARCRLEQKDAQGAAAQAAELLKRELKPEVRAGALLTLGRAQLALKQEAGTAPLHEVLAKHGESPVAPEAAQALLAHYQDAKLTARAEEIENLIASKYGAGAAALSGLLETADGHLKAGRLGDARKSYGDVLGRKPDRAARLRAEAGLAEVAAAEKKTPEALERLQRIAGDAPPPGFLARCRLRVAQASEKAGERAAAAAAYRAALSAEPDDETAPPALLALSRLSGDGDKPDEAETPLRELIERYPKSRLLPDALYSLAWLHLDGRNPGAARPVFVRLASDHPAHPLAADALFRVAEQDYERGELAAAAERYRAAGASQSPIAPFALYKLGWSLRRLKDHPAAAKAFLEAVARYPEHEVALECRVRAGEALLEAEQDAPAMEQFRAVLENDPTTEAERELKVQAKVGVAVAHLLRGEFDPARDLAGEVALPTNGWYGGRALLVRAEAVFLKDGAKGAVREYIRAATLFGRYPEIAAQAQFRAGECYEKLGDGKAARSAWQRAVGLYGGTPWAARCQEKLDAEPAPPTGAGR